MMKKATLLTILALMLAIVADAQGYRRWDFTSWSQQTVNNLMIEAAQERPAPGWSDIESAGNDVVGAQAPDATHNRCFWYDKAEGGDVKANGEVIVELQGLDFNPAYGDNRSLAIAVDYPSTAIGTYAGGQYLWLGGGNKAAGQRLCCFTIHNVPIGEKIKFVVESHRNGQARGLALFVNDVNDDANRIGEKFNTDAQATYTWENWMLPEGTTDEDGDGMVDIMVYNTNGCHVYSIEVGENTEARTVAYLYGGSLGDDLGYGIISGDYNNNVTPIEATKAFTYEELAGFDVVVLSSTVSNEEALQSLKQVRPFLPLLNMNPSIYNLWACGQTAESGIPFATVYNPAHALFRGLEVVQDLDAEVPTYVLPVTAGSSYTGLSALADPFDEDDIMGRAYQNDDVIAIHGHNLSHNGFLFIPYTQQALADALSPELLNNAVKMLAGSKAPVTQAPSPTVALAYDDMATTVTLSCNVPKAEIFYTTDGSEPTTESTRYTEPFTLTEVLTVKAVARGDGYLLSDVAEQEVDLRQMAPMPTFAMESLDGKTVVTISSEPEGATIYYNYKGDNTQKKSSRYESPITCTRGKSIYAFVVCEGYLDSKVATAQVHVKNPHVRVDVLSKMDSNREDYFNHTNEDSRNADQTVGYFFSWANSNSYPYYDPEYDETVTASDGTDSIIHHRLNPEEVVDIENGWSVRSRGQRISWEAANPDLNYGDSGSGPYNPATVEDEDTYLPVTSYLVNLTDWDSNNYPASGKIQTTQPLAGPFDVVAYIVNAKGNPSPRTVIEVSTSTADDAEWAQLGDTLDLPNTRRLYRMHVRSYEETAPVYVRTRIVNNVARASYLNIYIANEGELSKQIIADQESGIEDVQRPFTSTQRAIFNLSGVRQEQLHRGLNIVRQADGTTKKILIK